MGPVNMSRIQTCVLVAVVVISPIIVHGFPNTTAAVWPLSANYSATDYNKTLHGILQKVQFADGPTGFQKTSMQFDGMIGGYASFTNEAPALDVGLGSFTVATHVWLASAREGVILCWNGLKTFPNGLKIYIVSETLHVDLYSRDRGMEYGQLMKTFTFLRLTERQWNFIAVSFERQTNTITMMINDLKRDIHLPKDFNFGVSGIETRGGIFFGGHPKLTNPRPIQGRMSCSMLFRSVVGVEELYKAREECMSVLHGTQKSTEPLGIWPLDNEYSASDLSGYDLHGARLQYFHSDGPEGRKLGASTLGGPASASVDIRNRFNTLQFPTEISFFGHFYFEKLDDCELNSWHNEVNSTVLGPPVDGPQLVIRAGTVNVQTDKGHYVTDLCVTYSHSATIQPSGNRTSSCNDRLHVKAKTWHFMGFTYNTSTGIFTVWVDRVAVRYLIGKWTGIKSGQALKLAGLRAQGTSNTRVAPVTMFHGRMAWVFILGRGITVQEAYKLHQDTYRKLILEKKPFTPVTFWPLDVSTGLWDLSRYTLPGKVTGFSYTEGPSFQKQTAVKFTGSKDSYLVVESRDENLDLKSTISVFAFVRQATNADGTIVEWTGDANAGMMNGIQLGIKNGYVTVNLVRRGEKRQGNFFQGFQVVHGVWTFIGFTYDAADGLLLIWKDDQHPVIKNVGRFQVETRGKVYVAGRPNITENNFNGDVSCFSVYGAMMQKNDVMFVRRNCQQRMYIFKSPTSLYPLSKNYMAADLAGYGNNGAPENLAFSYGPDSTPDRSTLFLRNHGSKVSITNYDRQLDLNKQITLTLYVYPDEQSVKNATIVQWDGMQYSTQGLGLLIKNYRLTASVYPKEYSLEDFKLEANTWYVVGLTYQYYHATLRIWAEKFGLDKQQTFMAEKLVEPQLLATRGPVVVGNSPTILGATFSGRMACLMMYPRALGMKEGLAQSKQCFNDYLAKAPTVPPATPTHPNGPHTPTHGVSPSNIPGSHTHTSKRALMVPIIIVVSLAVLLVLVIIFIVKRRRSEDRERYRHTRLLDGSDESGYAEYHDDWDDEQNNDAHSLMHMGNVKRYNNMDTV